MEVWILLAAAGSGYLARRWQNALKFKGSSADEAEDDNDARPSHNMPSSRGRYRHFSSSARRQAGKPNHNWARPKSSGNLSEMNVGNRPMVEESATEMNGEGDTCNNADRCQFCEDPGGFKLAQDASDVKPDDLANECTRLEEVHAYSLSCKNVRCVGNLEEETSRRRNAFDWSSHEDTTDGQGSGDSSCLSLLRSVSGKRANDGLDGKSQKGGQVHQEGCAGKRMKDAMDSSNAANQGENCVFGSWMPGFWDVSEGVFVLDTESLLVQQGERSRGSSSRRSRTPNKHGRIKGFRKKRLVGQKPMSSLESCLSAQVGDDYFKRHSKSVTQPEEDFPKDLIKRFARYSGSYASETLGSISKTEFAIGLPSLSRMPSSKRFPSKTRTPRSSIDCKQTCEQRFNPFAYRRYEGASGTKWENRKGRASSSIKGLLFNFGVGVGMMFTVMSNMREVRRLTLLLKEAESLIKDLEDELEMKDESKSDFGSGKNDASLEQRQSFVASTLRKVKSATESLCNMRMILSTEPGTISTIDRAPSKDMSKLEAELEAELARMEFSLDDGDNSKHQNGLNALDVEVGNVVHGELTILGLPNEIEAYSDEDSSNSSHEDLHAQNYGVSPRALAKRLHEVLEAQQEERIRELEVELETLNSKLQAKEEEARWLTDKSRGLCATGDAEGLPSAERKLQHALAGHPQQKFSRRKEPTSQLKMTLSPNPSPVSPYTSGKVFNGVSNFNNRVEDRSTAFITLGGEALEAYKEACDEFSKLSLSGSESAFIAPSRPSEGNGKETCGKECIAEIKQLGSIDGWEQVDLVSLAQDFYGGGDHELLESMPTQSTGSFRERRGPRRKSRIKGHPEPENSFCSSRFVDSSDDGTNDTSGSTPCSIKFMDVRTSGYSQNDRLQGGEEAGNAAVPSYFDWSKEIMIRAGVNTPNPEDYQSFHPDLENVSGKHLSSAKSVDWKIPDENDYISELDEHLGQLLIRRIVEKSRKGSPLVQEAQTVLAHLEKNEPTYSSE